MTGKTTRKWDGLMSSLMSSLMIIAWIIYSVSRPQLITKLADAREMLSCQAKMHSSGLVLTAVLLSFAQLARAQAGSTTSPLFNFTRQGSETLLASSDDGSSGAISTSAPFVFYGTSQTSIYVSLLLHRSSLTPVITYRPCIRALMHLSYWGESINMSACIPHIFLHFCGKLHNFGIRVCTVHVVSTTPLDFLVLILSKYNKKNLH